MGFGLNPGIPGAGDTELATEAKQDEIITAIQGISGTVPYEARNDTTTDANLVYLGKALPGSAAGDAAWQIKRYNKSTGHMSFADDITTFTKTWDSRTSYSY